MPDTAGPAATGSSPSTLKLDGLRFAYGRRGPAVLDDVSATFRSRSIAVLGPNGAGKSTLFSILSTARTAKAGTFAVDGEPLGHGISARRTYRAGFGIVPQRLRITPGYTCTEFLRYVAWLKNVPADRIANRIATVLDQVDLTDRAAARVGTLSGGMHQRLCLAAGLINQPRLLLLDEPTAGLDPMQRSDLLAHLASSPRRRPWSWQPTSSRTSPPWPTKSSSSPRAEPCSRATSP
ncbi:ATP-binding cassette domain-containing protein [Nocardioides marmoraquaticus]